MMKRSAPHHAADHHQSCIVRNKRLALLSLIFSGVILAASLRAILRPLSGEREPVSVLVGVVYVISLMMLFIMRTRCWRERLWLGIAVTAATCGLVRGLLPSLSASSVYVLTRVTLLLWLGATVISLWFVISAFGTPSSRHGNGM
jgi:hypothetical protein